MVRCESDMHQILPFELKNKKKKFIDLYVDKSQNTL